MRSKSTYWHNAWLVLNCETHVRQKAVHGVFFSFSEYGFTAVLVFILKHRRNMQMNYDLMFFLTNIALGVGLAMDAFSVSLANGLSEPKMKQRKIIGVAGIFAIFQALMPLIGWICIHTIVEYFSWFEKLIPYIALILLSYIGGKMIYESIKCKNEEECTLAPVTFKALMVQGVATSIDALSVGFNIADYDLPAALIAALLIAAVTFVICYAGVIIGKRVGTALADKAGLLGGGILIAIGLEIFISGVFFG